MLFFSAVAAFAADAQPAGAGGGAPSSLVNLGLPVLLFVIFYFLLIRPQQKKAKEQKAMLSQIAKGDNVVTSAGIHGKIVSVSEDTVQVEIAENVKIKLSRDAIAVRKPQA